MESIRRRIDVVSTEADLQLIYDAATQTPCLNPRNATDVAAWVLGAARRMTELQAKVDLLSTLLKQRDAEAQDTLADAVKVEQERNEVRRLVRSLFEDYLDVIEESDSGREFRPISIGCCRAGEVEPLTQLLKDLRVAVGLPAEAPAPELERRA